MTISPPLGIGLVLIASVIGMIWLAPPRPDEVVLSVTLPGAVYRQLAQDTHGKLDAAGRPAATTGAEGLQGI